ncbi:MAG: porin family protein [Alphaproteobacteria bacterium]|nr:porin family protein [Alphaproteobacteria bacterium]
MKKLLCTAACIAAFTFPAQAQEMNFKPYVGFDLQRSVYDYNNYDIGGGLALDGNTILEDSLDGLNIHVGNRFYKNLGVEFGYFRTKEESKSIANGTTVGSGIVTAVDFSTDVKVQGIMLDGLGYLPLDKEGKFELIGTAGLSWSKAEFTATIPGTGSIDADESEIGFRVGGGAQVNFTDNINMRGLVRYQTADFDDVVDNAWTYGLGLNYSF